MRKLFSTKKRIAAGVLAVAIIAATGGIAAAYFTSTGTGSGSATVGTATNNIVVTGTTAADPFPGGPGVTVTFTAANSASQPEQLSTIHLASYTVDAGHVTAGCTSGLGVFTMTDVTVSVAHGKILAGATNQAVVDTGTLAMTDTLTNQNPCQGATLTLTFTTS
jgi:hypothetical protein